MTDLGSLTLAIIASPGFVFGRAATSLALAVGLLAVAAVPAASATSPTSTTSTTVPDPPAKAEMLIDLDTNRVLLQQNVHTPMSPGSLAKMLTAMIAYDWLPHDSEVSASVQAASVTPIRVGMPPGQPWPFAMVMQSLLIFSANDAAYALAQKVSGSVSRFGPVMAYAAAEIGLRDHPTLHDPSGLDGTEGFGGGDRISAWDLATIARDLMANPALAQIVGSKQLNFTAPNKTVYGLDSQNLYFLDTYPGAIGVKTGYTDLAGFCVVEEAVRGGRKMMAVVLNGKNSYQTAAFLLNQGFATPVQKESLRAPSLPPIVEPEPGALVPPLPTTATTGTTAAIPAGQPQQPRGARTVASVAPNTGIPSGVRAVVAGLLAGGAIAGAVTWRRRRSRPAGAHSRRD